jgi:hypothetical protein
LNSVGRNFSIVFFFSFDKLKIFFSDQRKFSA